MSDFFETSDRDRSGQITGDDNQTPMLKALLVLSIVTLTVMLFFVFFPINNDSDDNMIGTVPATAPTTSVPVPTVPATVPPTTSPIPLPTTSLPTTPVSSVVVSSATTIPATTSAPTVTLVPPIIPSGTTVVPVVSECNLNGLSKRINRTGTPELIISENLGEAACDTITRYAVDQIEPASYRPSSARIIYGGTSDCAYLINNVEIEDVVSNPKYGYVGDACVTYGEQAYAFIYLDDRP